MRIAYIAAFVVALVAGGASLAQVAAPRIIRPPVIQPVPNTAAVQAPAGEAIVQDPEKMKATINKLKKEKRELRQQLQMSVADLQEARRQLDEMTRLGGSLVTAQCVSPSLSRNTAGAEENCAASGYACEQVSGQCRRQCNVSTDCSVGFLCDTSVNRCVVPPTGD